MKSFFDEYLSEISSDFKDVLQAYKKSQDLLLSDEARELLRMRQIQKEKKNFEKKQKNKLNKHNLKTATEDLCFLDFLPYKTYDMSNSIFENENSYSFILRATHFAGTDLKAKKALKSLIENDIPENCIVQVINYSSPRIGNIIDNWQNASVNLDPLIAKIASNRGDFLKTGHWQSIISRHEYILRDYELYFCFSLPKQKFVSSKSSLYLLKDLQQKIIEGLKGSNCYGVILNNLELANFLQEILNPSLNLYKHYNKHYLENITDYFSSHQLIEMKKDQIVFSQEFVNPQDKPEHHHAGLANAENTANNFHYVVLEVTSYPSVWDLENSVNYLGHFDGDFSFPCPFYISFGYSMHSREQSIRNADKQRLIVTKQGDSKLPKFFPAMSAEIEDSFFVFGELASGARMGRCAMYVVLMIKDAVNIDRFLQSVISHFARLDFSLSRINHDVLNNFIHSLPFGMGESWDNMAQQKLLSKALSRACSNLMPVYGDQKNYDASLMIFAGRKGELFLFDNYKTYDHNDNMNMCVVGKSGSGKSVLLQEYAINILRLGGQVVILDDGRSFENPCIACGGDFVDFGGGNFCINPFSLYKAYSGSETGSDYNEFFVSPFIDLIVSILCILVNVDKDDKTSPDNGLYKQVMKDAAEIVMYKKGSSGGFADIRDELLNNEALRTKETTEIANKIAYILRGYSDGREKNYFNGTANISINNIFSVFEFSDLEHDQVLQNSVLLVIVFLVYSKMRDRGTRTVLIIDEAWRLLNHPAMSEFMQGIARRARKYQGCLIVASQSISDFANNKVAQIILTQCSWRIFLSVEESDADVLKRQVNFKDGEIHIAKGLSGVRGSYSEFMIKHQKGHWQIGRLLLDKFSGKLYSSTASDVVAIRKLKEQGYSIVDAIESLL